MRHEPKRLSALVLAASLVACGSDPVKPDPVVGTVAVDAAKRG